LNPCTLPVMCLNPCTLPVMWLNPCTLPVMWLNPCTLPVMWFLQSLPFVTVKWCLRIFASQLLYNLYDVNFASCNCFLLLNTIIFYQTLSLYYLASKQTIRVRHTTIETKEMTFYFILYTITSLLYKLDTLLLTQMQFPVLYITGFLFHMSTQVKAVTWARMWKKKPVISNTVRFFCFNSTVSYIIISVPV
jgi:hypothetical protein